MWYYDESANFIFGKHSRRGVRKGCVMGTFLCYPTMEHAYRRLAATLRSEGALYSYSDDAYILVEPNHSIVTLLASPTLYNKVGLRLGWGPGKTELVLPFGFDTKAFIYLSAVGIFSTFSDVVHDNNPRIP